MIATSTRAASKRHAVISAAQEVFRRYGFERTTMGDLAERAGMSRPALYLVFPTKVEIFKAMVEHESNDIMAAIQDGLADRPTLRAKLAFACDRVIVRNFEFVRRYPDAWDMFTPGFDCVEAAFGRFQTMVEGLIDTPSRASPLNIAPAELARTFVVAIRGFPDFANDVEDLRRLIDVQITLLLAALAAPESA